MKNLIHPRLGVFYSFVIYFIFAIITTFPLILNMNKYLIGRGGLDGFQYMWNMFSFWYQVSHFQSPFFTKLIFYPIGANLLFNDYSPLVSLIGLPFLKHPVLFLNLIVIFGLTFSAITAFSLSKYITKSNNASLVGGFIYGFSPTSASFILTQHYYYLVASVFLPLGVLFLLKFVDTPKKYLMTFFIICWVLFFINYYFFILLFLISGMLLITLILSDIKIRTKLINKDNLSYYLKSCLILVFIPSLIILGAVVHSMGAQSFIGSKSSYALVCNANLVGLFAPPFNKLSTLFHFNTNGDTPYYYLGSIFIFFVFCCSVFFRKEKYIVPLAVTALVILVFSSGLSISFGQITFLNNHETPFYWLSKIPFMGLIDCPVRFVSGVHLLVGLIVSIFFTLILRHSRLIAGTLLVLLFVSIFTDYKFPAFPFINVSIPTVYKHIAQYRDNKTVLELPSGLTESKGGFGYDWSSEGLHTQQMYWQTIYKKPRVGGYVSRIPDSTYTYFKNKMIISDLFTLTSKDGIWLDKQFSKEEIRRFVNNFNLGYIIIAPTPRQQEFSLAVEQVLSRMSYKKLLLDSYLLYKI